MLDVVDRDPPAPYLSGQRGSLRGRVGHKPGHLDTLAHGRIDVDDATTIIPVLQRRLRRDEYAADVDVHHAIYVQRYGRGFRSLIPEARRRHPKIGNFYLGRITRSSERIFSSADSELRLRCAAQGQSVLSQPLGSICAEIPVWHNTCTVSGTS